MNTRIAVLVGLGAFVLLAGCSSPGSLQMEEVETNETLVDETTRNASEILERPDPARGLLAALIEDGTARTTTDAGPPIENSQHFLHDGSYYRVNRTVTGTGVETRYGVEVDYNATDPSGERIQYEDLPDVDRRSLDRLLPPPETPPRLVDGPDIGMGITFNDSEQERSVILNTDNMVVIYDGDAYPVFTDEDGDVEVETYRYTFNQVASNDSTYALYFEQEYAFPLTDLGHSDRDVVETAIEDGSYNANGDGDDAFRGVVERFQQERAITADTTTGEWLVKYNDTLYWADLRYSGFEDFRED